MIDATLDTRQARDELALTLTDPPSGGAAFVASGRSEALPPPATARGLLGWMRQNMFSTPG